MEPIKEIKEIKETFITILKKPEMQILPGQIAFYFLMSIIPIAAICTIAASYVTESFNFTTALSGIMPDVLLKIITSLSSVHFEGLAIILILYLIVASNAPSSIIIASNMLYGIKQPKFVRLKIKAFFMVMMIVILLLFVVLIPLLGDVILHIIIQLMNGEFLYHYGFIYQIIKVIVSGLIMYTIIKFIYVVAPDAKIKSNTTTKGTIFTTLSWIIATYLFAFYITNIANYNIVYGNFANVLILLLWIYLLAYLFVVGMAINVDVFKKQGKCIYEKEKQKKGKKDRNKARKTNSRKN